MLEDYCNGWADWTFENFRGRVSYIVNFPFNVFEALIKYFETGEEQAIEFDAEGWSYTFKFSSNVVTDETVLYESTIDFANDFLCEIEENVESWAHFPAKNDSSEAYDELVEDIVKLRTLLLDEDLIDKWIEIVNS